MSCTMTKIDTVYFFSILCNAWMDVHSWKKYNLFFCWSGGILLMFSLLLLPLFFSLSVSFGLLDSMNEGIFLLTQPRDTRLWIFYSCLKLPKGDDNQKKNVHHFLFHESNTLFSTICWIWYRYSVPHRLRPHNITFPYTCVHCID